MAALVFGMMQSLDGYVAGVAGGPQLPVPGDQLHRHFNDYVRALAGMVYGRRMYEVMRYWDDDQPGWDDVERDFAMAWRGKPGRRTYDLWAGFWPKIKGGPFADSLNAATKYVATHRPDSLGWGPVGHLGPDIMAGVCRVKSQDGPDLIVWGSSTLTSVLLEQGLADEVVLIVYPVLLGAGKRFFSDSADPRELALVSSKATSTGALLNTYRHVGSLRTESVARASG